MKIIPERKKVNKKRKKKSNMFTNLPTQTMQRIERYRILNLPADWWRNQE